MDENLSLKSRRERLGELVLGKYQLLEIVGSGGMSTVYKALQKPIDRFVAFKVMTEDGIGSPQNAQRLQREAKAVGLLSHPNIVAVFDSGQMPDGRPYMVMDYLPGMTLQELIRDCGSPNIDCFFELMFQLCDGLHHAHERGIIHRDLKPSNILLHDYSKDELQLKIVDFGIAKVNELADGDAQRLTATGETCGTCIYMSPEQCRGVGIDRRSDIYSLGCVMYELVSGKPPFIGETVIDTMLKHISESPQPLHQICQERAIPGCLESVIFKALAKEQSDRYQNVAELQKDLLVCQKILSNPGSASRIAASELGHLISSANTGLGAKDEKTVAEAPIANLRSSMIKNQPKSELRQDLKPNWLTTASIALAAAFVAGIFVYTTIPKSQDSYIERNSKPAPLPKKEEPPNVVLTSQEIPSAKPVTLTTPQNKAISSPPKKLASQTLSAAPKSAKPFAGREEHESNILKQWTTLNERGQVAFRTGDFKTAGENLRMAVAAVQGREGLEGQHLISLRRLADLYWISGDESYATQADALCLMLDNSVSGRPANYQPGGKAALQELQKRYIELAQLCHSTGHDTQAEMLGRRAMAANQLLSRGERMSHQSNSSEPLSAPHQDFQETGFRPMHRGLGSQDNRWAKRPRLRDLKLQLSPLQSHPGGQGRNN